ncbi:hypothetical protein A2Y85_01815 [candidate division WOR-3 bacterium RBG_13_43_14]|uniref:Helicase ATP-binding domain-containing protein n=1 Tax=candidate division WOR-3 bacterium RBG_13_43_14 TaxID=1802590 RepID=A0A1F4UEL9_UNCW3|nr:MAG: hypothetical protein A2Y85_01815 [candidate division WOR-3 bacterium RBG_13_43_14]
MKSIINISVRDLLDFCLRRGDLDLTTFGAISTTEGIKAHQQIQNQRPEEYQSEVFISHEIETLEYILQITGRMDGLRIADDQIIIDEIKTTKQDLTQIELFENPLHWAQVKCYAYMYAQKYNLGKIDVQLTYFNIDEGKIKEIKHEFTIDELRAYFEPLISTYIKWMDKIHEWTTIRNDSINNLAFPFRDFRHGQEKIMSEVGYAIADQIQLLVEAPTGIGKTLAISLPALQTLGRNELFKIFYLTARTTGRNAAEAALNILREKGLRIKSLSLIAKDKICPNPDRLCNGRDCKFAAGYYNRANNALQSAFENDNFSHNAITDLAIEYQVCPFEFSLELSLWCDFIICDYNYVFDPKVYLRRFFDDDVNDYCFLIDEAHNLIERARAMYSAELNKKQFLELRQLLKNKLPKLYRSLGKINTTYLKIKKQYGSGAATLAENDPPSALQSELEKFSNHAEEWLALNQPADFREVLLDLYFDVRGFLKTAERFDSNYATCYNINDQNLSIKIFCVNPAYHLRSMLEHARSSIFFSGTLKPTEYFLEALGCDGSARHISLPSPFASENLGILVTNRVSTFFRNRHHTKEILARTIVNLIKHRTGNYLVYFPSYEYLQMTFDCFKKQDPNTSTIIQTSNMTEQERLQFIAQFSHESKNSLVGFAVMGGAFSESIDLIGDRLTGAVIVGVGLPPVSTERELIREYFDSLNGNGYAYAYQYPGIIKVLQAAGRVIRSENDRGIVLLIDTRILTPPYDDILPREWDIKQFIRPDELNVLLDEFWGI